MYRLWCVWASQHIGNVKKAFDATTTKKGTATKAENAPKLLGVTFTAAEDIDEFTGEGCDSVSSIMSESQHFESP